MNTDKLYTSVKKREKLMALVERRRNGGLTRLKKRFDTSSMSRLKESTRRRILNSHLYKKLFAAKKAKDGNDIIAKKSCSGSRRKKQRLCSGQGSSETFHQSRTENMIESGTGELTEKNDQFLPYVNKLRDYWNKGQNAVVFDGQDRLAKVVLFISSLPDNTKNPVLILASSKALSLWETEFSKWTKSVNVVMYKGNKDSRAEIRYTKLYSENGGIKFQVILSSPDAFVEDMEVLDHIWWELLVIDECQGPIFIPHFKKLGMLATDMRLLTVSGESADVCQSYQYMLSLIDSEHETVDIVADIEVHDNINTLKEKLSPFIAFECKFDTCDFEEYWVPALLSSMQIKQYCTILASNVGALSSSSRISSLSDIVIETLKCCDHPYLVDPDLRHSLKEALLTDPDAEINLSGKMQLLDKLLIEIKRCGLRALILYQSAVNSEKISTGNCLDDLVCRRFGENSYVHIPKEYYSWHFRSKPLLAKKNELLKKFNHAESERFICLFDYHICNSSITLSRVDVVILFNSNGNLLNDIKSLKRITFDSPRERLQVFRLYSAFTVEEKALILLKQGTNFNYGTRVCHQLLAWGASYLFSKNESCIDSGSLSFIDDLVDELSSVLRNTSAETDPTNCSMISKAQMQNGVYSGSMLLFGETETHIKDNVSVEEDLITNTPSVFWSNLLEQCQDRPENLFSRPHRKARQSSRIYSETQNYHHEATPSVVDVVRSMPKKKRKRAGKSIPSGGKKKSQRFNATGAYRPILPSTSVFGSVALNPTTNGGQQGQSDQPTHTSSSSPLGIEIERIQKERERIIKSHEEKKTMLLYECEKEISEIQKKYDAQIHDSEMSFQTKIQPLENYQQLVDAHKLLAEVLAQSLLENLDTNIFDLDLNRSELYLKRKQKETSSFNISDIHASTLAQARDRCSTNGPTTYSSAHSLSRSGLHAPAPHLRSNPLPILHAPAPHLLPATSEPFLESLHSLSNTQTPSCIKTESNNGFYQVYTDFHTLPPMEDVSFYDEGGSSLPYLGSDRYTF